MLKYYPVAISESFIKDQARSLSESIELYHGPWPIKFGSKISFFTITLWLLVKAVSRISTFFYTVLCYFLIKRTNPNIVFIQYGTTAAMMYKACVWLNKPFIIHFHGSDAHLKRVRRKFGKQYAKMFQHATTVVVVSKEMENALIDLGARPASMITIPYGIDTTVFLQKKSSDFYLTVGRFVPKKSPQATIQAFAMLLKVYPDKKLVMIGDGPLLPKCKALVQQLKIESAVTFLGKQDRNTIIKYMSEAFCFLQHSVTADNGDKEGSPVAITEAAACGIPVIATKHAGIPEIVKDGITGFLVDEHDIQGMANAMIRIEKLSKQEYEHMSILSRNHIKTYFDQKNQMESLRKIIYQAY